LPVERQADRGVSVARFLGENINGNRGMTG
jgi:hypothetical protein